METLTVPAETAVREWGETITAAMTGCRVVITRHGKPAAVLYGARHDPRQPFAPLGDEACGRVFNRGGEYEYRCQLWAGHSGDCDHPNC